MKQLNYLFYPIFTLALSSILLLSACQTLPTTTSTAPGFTQQQKQLRALHAWKVKGALGIQQTQAGWSGTFNWIQKRDEYALQFFGPLGAGTFRIVGQPNKVTLMAGKDKTITAADPETLLFRASGWHMPISSIQYWIRGLPTPGPYSPHQLDAQNHLQQITQYGWTVYFERYQSVGAFSLPTKLVLERPPIKIRILLKKWEV
ncbi:MAG: lipoprotein insertase outer membrane protein LolB [Gammaproteobacteria bacterium]